MKTNLRLRFAQVARMGMTVLAISLIPGVSFGAEDQGQKITVMAVKGDVRTGRTTPKVGDRLKPGMMIEVGAKENSEIDLKYAVGHQIRFKAGAKVKLGGARVELLAGKMFMHFVKGPGASDFTIRSKGAVAGVRGTRFLIEENEKKGTYYCVCEGQIEVSRLDGSEKHSVKIDEDLWAKPDQPIKDAIDSPDMSKMTAQEFATMNF